MLEFDSDGNVVLSSFGRPGHMAGEFTSMHTLAVDSSSNLYLGETVGGGASKNSSQPASQRLPTKSFVYDFAGSAGAFMTWNLKAISAVVLKRPASITPI
jgi:hypothetical protein